MRFKDFGTASLTVFSTGSVSVSSTVPSDSEALRRLELKNKEFLDPWRVPVNSGSSSSKIFTVRNAEQIVGQVILFNFQENNRTKSCSISYWIDRDSFGQGIATAAVELIVEHAFRDLGVHEVDAVVQPENKASIRVIEKLRYDYRDMIGEGKIVNGRWQNYTLYTVTRNLKNANL